MTEQHVKLSGDLVSSLQSAGKQEQLSVIVRYSPGKRPARLHAQLRRRSTAEPAMRHPLVLAAITLAVALLAGGLHSPRVSAHAGENILPVRLAVTEWASALQGDDAVAMAGLLSAKFPGRERYIAALPLTPITRVDLRHATLRIDG